MANRIPAFQQPYPVHCARTFVPRSTRLRPSVQGCENARTHRARLAHNSCQIKISATRWHQRTRARARTPRSRTVRRRSSPARQHVHLLGPHVNPGQPRRRARAPRACAACAHACARRRGLSLETRTLLSAIDEWNFDVCNLSKLHTAKSEFLATDDPSTDMSP